jgi:hypothetical protein
MSYTRIVTLTKTSQTPDNALSTMPALPDVATPEQIAAYQAAFPSEWSIQRTSDSITTTMVFASKEVHDAALQDPIAVAIWNLRKQWIAENHITETVQTI